MGSTVGVHKNHEVKGLTPKAHKQLKDHVTQQAVIQIRRLIRSDPTVLKHLSKHAAVRDALRKAAAPRLKRLRKKKKA